MFAITRGVHPQSIAKQDSARLVCVPQINANSSSESCAEGVR
jgi:hypothetical protein